MTIGVYLKAVIVAVVSNFLMSNLCWAASAIEERKYDKSILYPLIDGVCGVEFKAENDVIEQRRNFSYFIVDLDCARVFAQNIEPHSMLLREIPYYALFVARWVDRSESSGVFLCDSSDEFSKINSFAENIKRSDPSLSSEYYYISAIYFESCGDSDRALSTYLDALGLGFVWAEVKIRDVERRVRVNYALPNGVG